MTTVSFVHTMGSDDSKGGKLMYRIREGLIPTILGFIVTALGILLTQNRRVDRMVSNTILGFGLGHIVLGVIDLFEHRYYR